MCYAIRAYLSPTVLIVFRSTVSSGINALSATALEDFVKLFYPNLKESTAAVVSKLLVVFFGLLSFSLVFIAAQMGGVLQVRFLYLSLHD